MELQLRLRRRSFCCTDSVHIKRVTFSIRRLYLTIHPLNHLCLSVTSVIYSAELAFCLTLAPRVDIALVVMQLVSLTGALTASSTDLTQPFVLVNTSSWYREGIATSHSGRSGHRHHLAK